MQSLPDFIAGGAAAVSVAYVPNMILPMLGPLAVQPGGFAKHIARGVTAWGGSYLAQMAAGKRAGDAFFLVGSTVTFLGVVNEWFFGGTLPTLSYYPDTGEQLGYYRGALDYYPSEQLAEYTNPGMTLEDSYSEYDYAGTY